MKFLNWIKPLWAGVVTLILAAAGILANDASLAQFIEAIKTPASPDSIPKYLPCLGAVLGAVLTGRGLLSKNATEQNVKAASDISTGHHQDTREMMHHEADDNKAQHKQTQAEIAALTKLVEEKFGDSATPEQKRGFAEALADIAASRDSREAPAVEAVEEGRFEDAADYLMNISRQEGAAVDDMSRHIAKNARNAGKIYALINVAKTIAAYEQAVKYDGTYWGDYTYLSRAYVKAGNLPAAKEALETAQSLPDLSDRDRSVLFNELGNIAVAQGDLPAAKTAYEEGLKIHQRLAAKDPDNTEWQRDLSVSHNKLGDIAVAQGDLPAAKTAYEESLKIRQRLAAKDPDNTEWQRDLSVSHGRLGDIAKAQGDLPAAQTAYEESLKIRQRLAAKDPDNTEWQRDLSISHNKLGDIAVAQGELPAAKTAFEDGLEIHQRLAAKDPDNTEWQRDLSVSHSRLGNMWPKAI